MIAVSKRESEKVGMDDKLRKELDGMETEILGAQTLAVGAMWATLPAICAMIDAGLIERARLLKIIDALHGMAAAEDRLGDVEDATLGLERLRMFLEQADLRPGSVVETLQELERLDGDHFLGLQGRRPSARE